MIEDWTRHDSMLSVDYYNYFCLNYYIYKNNKRLNKADAVIIYITNEWSDCCTVKTINNFIFF